MNYPEHYLEIILKDLDLSCLHPQYQKPGSTIPCTLSSLMTGVTGRSQPVHCIVANLEIYTSTILLRVADVGPMASGTYNLTLDDFVLPAMTAALEDSAPFHICLLYHSLSASDHY